MADEVKKKKKELAPIKFKDPDPVYGQIRKSAAVLRRCNETVALAKAKVAYNAVMGIDTPVKGISPNEKVKIKNYISTTEKMVQDIKDHKEMTADRKYLVVKLEKDVKVYKEALKVLDTEIQTVELKKVDDAVEKESLEKLEAEADDIRAKMAQADASKDEKLVKELQEKLENVGKAKEVIEKKVVDKSVVKE